MHVLQHYAENLGNMRLKDNLTSELVLHRAGACSNEGLNTKKTVCGKKG